MISHDLGPSDTLALRDDLVEGFATDIGGRTSHTAILAQGLEIPAVVGLKEVTSYVQSGDLIIVGWQRWHWSLSIRRWRRLKITGKFGKFNWRKYAIRKIQGHGGPDGGRQKSGPCRQY